MNAHVSRLERSGLSKRVDNCRRDTVDRDCDCLALCSRVTESNPEHVDLDS